MTVSADQSMTLLKPREAAELMRVSINQLMRMRVLRNGPRYSRIGQRVIRYALADVRQYLDDRAESPTRSDAA